MPIPVERLPVALRRLATEARGLGPDDVLLTTHPAAGGRPAAVLILLGDGPDGPDVLLIERAASLRSHAGQPAFPGGSLDSEDAGPIEAALREAEEEVGLDPGSVELIAELPTAFIPVSGFTVTPVLAWWRDPHAVTPVDAGEVAAVVRIPLSTLADPALRVRVRHPMGYVGPAFEAGGLLIWGFTAGLLDRVIRLGGWERPWEPGRERGLPDRMLGDRVPGPAEPDTGSV